MNDEERQKRVMALENELFKQRVCAWCLERFDNAILLSKHIGANHLKGKEEPMKPR